MTGLSAAKALVAYVVCMGVLSAPLAFAEGDSGVVSDSKGAGAVAHWILVPGPTTNLLSWALLEDRGQDSSTEETLVPFGLVCSQVSQRLGVSEVVCSYDDSSLQALFRSLATEKLKSSSSGFSSLSSILEHLDNIETVPPPHEATAELCLPVSQCRLDRLNLFVPPSNCVLRIRMNLPVQERRTRLVYLCKNLPRSDRGRELPAEPSDRQICEYLRDTVFGGYGVEIKNVSVDPRTHWVLFDSACKDVALVASFILAQPVGRHPYDLDTFMEPIPLRYERKVRKYLLYLDEAHKEKEKGTTSAPRRDSTSKVLPHVDSK